MTDSIGLALLAAGKGTRLKIDTPKPLLPLLGKKMVDYVLDTASEFAIKVNANIIYGAVVGHAKAQVVEHLQAKYPQCLFAEQVQQLGTADAMRSYFTGIPAASEQKYTLVACADTPLLTADSLPEGTRGAWAASEQGGPLCASWRSHRVRAHMRIMEPRTVGGVVDFTQRSNPQGG